MLFSVPSRYPIVFLMLNVFDHPIHSSVDFNGSSSKKIYDNIRYSVSG